MKIAYQLIFLVSIVMLVLFSVIDVAIPRDESVAARLADASSKWEIRYLPQNGLPDSITDPIKTKSLLVEFLKKNRIPTYRKMAEVNYCIMIVCCCSLVGWIRESRIATMMKARPPATAVVGSGK